MNDNNYEFLADQIKMSGFGDKLKEALKEQMQKGEDTFRLDHQVAHNDKQMNYSLEFRKSNTQDNYFFNSYTAKLSRFGEKDVSNTFYTDKRITAKEAFNLLEGRSVEKKYNRHEEIIKDGKKTYKPIKDSTYNVWSRIDFNDADPKGNFKLVSYGEQHGFNLEEKLGELPIVQLRDPEDRLELYYSLRKGNITSVKFEVEGVKEERFLVANPRKRDIDVYDADMQLIEDKKQAKTLQLPGMGQGEGIEQQEGHKVEDANQGQDKSNALNKDSAKQEKTPKTRKGLKAQ